MAGQVPLDFPSSHGGGCNDWDEVFCATRIDYGGERCEAAHAIELQAGTIHAWQECVRTADSHLQAQLDTQKAFLWTDEDADRRLRARRGEVIVLPVVGHGTQEAPNGLIHHWTGAAFISNATIESLLAVVHDYDRYREIYQPVVADSKALSCTAENAYDDASPDARGG